MGQQGGHTAGPWDVVFDRDDRRSLRVSAPGGKYIAVCVERGSLIRDQAEFEANARLIAAAPELLDALEEVVTDLQFSEAPQHRNLVTLARAAIAKAKGES